MIVHQVMQFIDITVVQMVKDIHVRLRNSSVLGLYVIHTQYYDDNPERILTGT